MSFASLQFAVFMVAVYSLYVLLPHRWQNRMLLLASYLFYAAWDWRFLSLILASTVVDYWVGLLLDYVEEPHRRLRCVMISVITNLSLLGTFKYFGFFADSLNAITSRFGIDLGWSGLNIVLPVGISFYTFQTMSYTIDVYRGKLKPTRRFLDFALFVAFFPQLVAGPIERAVNLLPRLQNPRTLTLDQTTRGLYLILFGLFKKVAVADGLASAVGAIYECPGDVSGVDVLLATYLFAVQIYCDFSGYSDIARGVAKILGLDLMANFNLPYFATNPSDFWQRWHISLSSWLRDYLYIPLGGNRGSLFQIYRNLTITMLLGGLWHGAGWNFVLWGAYQGLVLCVHRFFVQRRGQKKPAASGCFKHVRSFAKVVVYFHVTCYGWLLFRANSWEQIIEFTRKVFCVFDLSVLVPWYTRQTPTTFAAIVVLLVVDCLEYVFATPHWYRKWAAPVRGGLYAAMFMILLLGMSNEPAQFIYFQF